MDLKKWAPNPYAIGQLLNGRGDLKFLREASGKDADDFLRKAFRLTEKWNLGQALTQFQELAVKVDGPMPLEKVMALTEFKNLLKDDRYKEDQIRRVLPLLVQVSDAQFGSAQNPPPVAPSILLASFEETEKLLVDQATYLDPIQGDTADCYLISSMIGLAWTDSNRLQASLTTAGSVAGAFDWKFHSDPPAPLIPVNVTSQVPLDGDFPLFARSSEPTEHWPSLLEKAYVVKIANDNQQVLTNGEPSPANYQFIANGALPQNACQALVGGVPHPEALDTPPGQKIFSFSQNNQLRGALATTTGVMSRPVMVWRDSDTDNADDPNAANAPVDTVWEDTGLFPDHAYSVLGVMQSGSTVNHVVLRNPYGYATDERRPGYKSGVWNPAGRPPVTLNKNGVFAISHALFYQHFNNIGWIDL